MLTRILPFLIPALLSAGMAQAQGSLGIQSLSAHIGTSTTSDHRNEVSGLAQLDVRITDVHGLQLDIGLVDHGSARIGHLAAHLYMQPNATHKYGLFATVSDVDNVSIQYMNAGIEGRIALSERTTLDGRFGIGGSTGLGGGMDQQWDYVFASAAITHDFTPRTRLIARVDVAEFDEQTFRAIGLDSSVRLTHGTSGSPMAIYAELENAALFGRGSAPSVTSLGVGVVMTLGAAAEDPMARAFDMATPFDQLVTRGIVASF